MDSKILKPRRKIELGDRFGRLVVIGPAKDEHKRKYYRCRCDCGTEKDVCGSLLSLGHTRSCGCLGMDMLMERNITHGRSKTRTYNIWCAMKERCNTMSVAGYKNYGGRGIIVCDRWLHSFENFLEDMGECPSKNHSIDRIDINGNYEPSNCRWATTKEQGNNTRRNVRIEHNGEMKTISEVSDIVGLPYRTIYYRIFAYGWTPDRAVSTPVNVKYHRKTNPWKKS